MTNFLKLFNCESHSLCVLLMFLPKLSLLSRIRLVRMEALYFLGYVMKWEIVETLGVGEGEIGAQGL